MKLILINPTDDELDAAFAVHVAGEPAVWVSEAQAKRRAAIHDGANPGAPIWSWRYSMDAVLPWLEKLGWRGTSNRAGDTCAATVEVNSREWDGNTFTAQQDYTHTQTPLPRAAVIALLMAHGVEVIFKDVDSAGPNN